MLQASISGVPGGKRDRRQKPMNLEDPYESGQDEVPTRTRAVIYARMSTEHQQYSTENQCDVIREYAAKNNMDVVHVYTDDGKSGLQLSGRNSLKQLIEDVNSPDRGFSAILVYDVSRWGRFQDSDESAYYEYICRRAGADIHYCAEQFSNDGSPVSTFVKGVKRAMAGEYSRELSAKVFKGQCRLIQLGYRQGGTAGYGLLGNGIPDGWLHTGARLHFLWRRSLAPGDGAQRVCAEDVYVSSHGADEHGNHRRPHHHQHVGLASGAWPFQAV